MDNSLSVILPVHNAERSLATQVTRLLEMLPELTASFEVLIVDDASTDHTADIAAELAREYPQLRVIRHARPQGHVAAVRSGMQRKTGAVAFVQDAAAPLSATQLRRQWNARSGAAPALPKASATASVIDSGALNRLSAWGRVLQASPQPLPRPELLTIRHPDVGAWAPKAEASKPAVAIPRIPPGEQLARTDVSHADAKTLPVRSFLKHLRNLALGE